MPAINSDYLQSIINGNRRPASGGAPVGRFSGSPAGSTAPAAPNGLYTWPNGNQSYLPPTGSPGTGNGTTTFNSNPSPQGGDGAFGLVPGPVGMPDPLGDLAAAYPNLRNTNSAASAAILSKLRGELSPETLNQIQDAAARFGVANGMPGSNAVSGTIANNANLLGNVRASEALQQQGLEDYSHILPTVSGTQTVNPNLQVEVASGNANNAAAPNPEDAATYAQNLFQKYLDLLKGQSNPAGGTGVSNTPKPTAPAYSGPSSNVPWWTQGGNASKFGGGSSYSHKFPGSDTWLPGRA